MFSAPVMMFSNVLVVLMDRHWWRGFVSVSWRGMCLMGEGSVLLVRCLVVRDANHLIHLYVSSVM